MNFFLNKILSFLAKRKFNNQKTNKNQKKIDKCKKNIYTKRVKKNFGAKMHKKTQKIAQDCQKPNISQDKICTRLSKTSAKTKRPYSDVAQWSRESMPSKWRKTFANANAKGVIPASNKNDHADVA